MSPERARLFHEELTRFPAELFQFDPRIRDGWLSDRYFVRTARTLKHAGRDPVVHLQFFAKRHGMLAGTFECIRMLQTQLASGFDPRDLDVETLHDGDLIEPGRVRLFLKLEGANLLAALPSRRTADVLALIADVYPGMEPARSVIQTSLQNANPVIHPAVTLANAARIEGTGGDFLFYEEGVTDSVGRLIEAVDRERIAIGARLGFEISSDPAMGIRQGYMLAENYGEAYREAPGFQGIGAQPQLDHRYLHEDVGYGLVFMSSLAKQIGVETPTMDAVIQFASVVMDRDYAGAAPRSPESLGIGDLSVKELIGL